MRVGGGVGRWGKVVVGKWRQLYLNNNKKEDTRYKKHCKSTVTLKAPSK